MPRGSKPGERRGGRKKGTPNKVTTAAREAFLATFHSLAPELEGWIKQTAEGVEVPVKLKDGTTLMNADGTPIMVHEGANPAKAAELLVRMAEYHYPKKSQAEVTGKDGGPVEVSTIERVIIDPAKQ
jgi:hypothetical protein